MQIRITEANQFSSVTGIVKIIDIFLNAELFIKILYPWIRIISRVDPNHWHQGCGSAFIFCESGTGSFSEYGSRSGSSCFKNADPDPA